MSTKLVKLLQSGLTVFNLDDLGIIWGQKDRSATRQSARDYAAHGSLIRLRQGIYALPDVQIDTNALANKLLVPSYVTGLTVLTSAGLSHQFTLTVSSVAAYNKTYEVQGKTFAYSQIKTPVLYNQLGLDITRTTSVATVERAVTDLIYLSKGLYPFETLDGIDWYLLESYAKIYESTLVLRAVAALREQYAQ